MAVIKRGENWHVYYYVRAESGDRTKKWESFGSGEFSEARARARDIQVKGERVNAPSQEGMTIAALLEIYHNKHLVQDTTRDSDFYRIDRILIPALGQLYADTLTTDDLDAYVNSRSASGRSIETIVRELGILRSAYSWAESRTPPLVIRHPLRGYSIPRSKKQSQVKINPISQQDLSALLQHAPEHLMRAMLLQWYLGERPGRETLGIRWSDLNWDHEEMLIRSARKGSATERYVPIHPALMRSLIMWKEADASLGDCTLVHYNGRPVQSIKTTWKTTKLKAGITRRLRLYDFRHAWFTNVLRSGGDLKSVSEMGGHSRADTTLIFYQHTVREQHRKAIGMVPEIKGHGG